MTTKQSLARYYCTYPVATDPDEHPYRLDAICGKRATWVIANADAIAPLRTERSNDIYVRCHRHASDRVRHYANELGLIVMRLPDPDDSNETRTYTGQ